MATPAEHINNPQQGQYPNLSDRTEGTFRINVDMATLAFFAIFLLAFGARCLLLEDRIFHHDESQYAKYSWDLYANWSYEYDPLLHGPFLFHFTTLVYFVMGDSDFSARFVSVISSMVCIWFIWMFRHNKEFGKGSAVIASALVGFSPIMLYFSRTIFHDLIFSMHTLAVPAFYVAWLKYRKKSLLVWAAVFFAFMHATKANAFITTIVYLGFGIMWSAWELWRKDSDETLGERMHRILANHSFMAKWWLYVVLWGIIFTGGFAVQHVAKWGWFSEYQSQDITETGKIFFGLMFAFFILLSAFFIWVQWLYDTDKRDKEDAFLGLPSGFFSDGVLFGWSFFLFGAINILLHTSFFQARDGYEGIWDGAGRWFTYWYHQHDIARIRGPFWYYLPHFTLYETLTFSVFIVAFLYFCVRYVWPAVILAGYTFISVVAYAIYNNSAGFKSFADSTFGLKLQGTMMGNGIPLDTDLYSFANWLETWGLLIVGAILMWFHLRDKKPMRGYALEWSVISLAVYSYLQEKVPWLGVHMILPMHVYVAMALRDLWEWKTEEENLVAPVKAAKWALGAPIAIMALMMVHQSVLLNYYHGDNAVEQMVYVHTNRDFYQALETVEEIAEATGMGYNLPIAVSGQCTFPLSWYLRDYKKVHWSMPPNDNYPIAFTNWHVDGNTNQLIKDIHADKFADYTGTRIDFRSWWIPTTNEWLAILSPGSADRQNLWNYFLRRERFNPQPHPTLERYGSVDVIMWVHNDVKVLNNWETATVRNRPLWDPNQRWRPPVQPGSRRNRTSDASAAQINDTAEASPDRRRQQRPASQIKRVNPAPANVIGMGGNGRGEFAMPKDIAFDTAGNIYVADTENHRVQKLSPEGQFLMSIGRGEGDGQGQFNKPHGVAVSSDGLVYVADTWNHRIQVFNASDGSFVRAFGSGEIFFAPKDIYIDDTSNQVWVVNTGQHNVRVFTKEGTFRSVFGRRGEEGEAGAFFEPVGIAAGTGPDGSKRIYVADTANSRIHVLNSQGRFIDEWAVDGWEDFYAEPYLATDSQGRVYYTDSSRNRMGVFSNDGELLAYWGTIPGNRPGQFTAPRGMGIRQDGTIIVSDTGNSRLQAFSPLEDI